MENKDVVSQLHQTHMLRPDIFRFPDGIQRYYKLQLESFHDILAFHYRLRMQKEKLLGKQLLS